MRQLTIVLALTLGLPAFASQSEVENVLRTASDYIAQYERDITAVSAEEDYIQRVATDESPRAGVSGSVQSLSVRRLRSHLVLIAEPATGWVEFRDVFEVDGRLVRDRHERLVRLFLTPGSDQQAQAGRIVAESARFNLNPPRVNFRRTLNVPMTALRFLRGANQPRSTFELRGSEQQDGRTLSVVRFKEQSMPRLIGSDEGSAAQGTFWIDSRTGAVTKSELEMLHQRVAAKLTVKYAEHPTEKLWLPKSMEEIYTIALTQATVFGQATYSNFKRFRVETTTSIK
jgi:hypothetical protein